MTTRDPGARLVFTHGWTVSPRATAFRAKSPAATITLGLLGLVQLVIAAITTAPWWIVELWPFSVTVPVFARAAASSAKPRFAVGAVSDSANVFLTAPSTTRSCGRFGPARQGTTVERSSDNVDVNSGVGAEGVRNSPCSFM